MMPASEDGEWTPEVIAKLQHDLRNPLTAIMGFAQLLEATELNADQAEFLGKVLDAAQRLLEVIEAIDERVPAPGAKRQ